MFFVHLLLTFIFFLQVVDAQFRSSGFVFDRPQLTIDGTSSINGTYNFTFALSGNPNSDCTVLLLSDLYSMSKCTVQFNSTNWDRPVVISAVPYSLFNNFTGAQALPITFRSLCRENSPFHNIEGILPTIRTGLRGARASVTGTMNIIPFQQTLPYSFQSPGFYYLLKSDSLTVQSLNSPFMGESVVITGLFVRYGNYAFAIDPSVVDKSKAIVEITPDVPRTFRILNSRTRSTEVFNINFADGAAMTVDIITSVVNGRSLSCLNVHIEVPPSFKGTTSGLFGGFFDDPNQTFLTTFGAFIPPNTIYSQANKDPNTGAFSLNFLRSFTESWKVPDDDIINNCRDQCSGVNRISIPFPFRECGIINFPFAPNPIRVPNYIIANLSTNPMALFNLPNPEDPFARFNLNRQPPINVVPSINSLNVTGQSPLTIASQIPQPVPMGFAPILQLPSFQPIAAPAPLPVLPPPPPQILANVTRLCSQRIPFIPGSNVDPAPFIRSCEIDIRRQMNPETVLAFYESQCTRLASQSILAMTLETNVAAAQNARALAQTYNFGNFSCTNCNLCTINGCVICATADLEPRAGRCVPRQQPITYQANSFPAPPPVPNNIPVSLTQPQSFFTSPQFLQQQMIFQQQQQQLQLRQQQQTLNLLQEQLRQEQLRLSSNAARISTSSMAPSVTSNAQRTTTLIVPLSTSSLSTPTTLTSTSMMSTPSSTIIYSSLPLSTVVSIVSGTPQISTVYSTISSPPQYVTRVVEGTRTATQTIYPTMTTTVGSNVGSNTETSVSSINANGQDMNKSPEGSKSGLDLNLGQLLSRTTIFSGASTTEVPCIALILYSLSFFIIFYFI